MPGKQNWYFADGYLPEKVNNGPMEAHEALMFFNPSKTDAVAIVTVYFSDRDPLPPIEVKVPAERVIAIRLDHKEETGGVQIPPLTQYALGINATVPIICQFGRVDTTQSANAYYVGVGWAE